METIAIIISLLCLAIFACGFFNRLFIKSMPVQEYRPLVRKGVIVKDSQGKIIYHRF